MLKNRLFYCNFSFVVKDSFENNNRIYVNFDKLINFSEFLNFNLFNNRKKYLFLLF
jgi:hypothetical protein